LKGQISAKTLPNDQARYNEIQGFYYAKPMRLNELKEYCKLSTASHHSNVIILSESKKLQ